MLQTLGISTTYEISHLIHQYVGNQQFQYIEMLTQDGVRVITYMLGTKKALMLVSCSTTNREILFKFLLKKNPFHMCKTEEQMKFPCI